MNLIILRFFQISLFLFAPLSLSAADWYVDDNSNTNDVFTATSAAGNDASAGSALAPFATINKAILSAAAGDFIWVDAGVYNESLGLAPGTNGTAVTVDNLTITGAGYALTVVDHNFHGPTAGYFLWVKASGFSLKEMTVQEYSNNGAAGGAGHSGQALTIGGTGSTITDILIENVSFNGNGTSSGNPAISVLARSTVIIKGGGSFCCQMHSINSSTYSTRK